MRKLINPRIRGKPTSTVCGQNHVVSAWRLSRLVNPGITSLFIEHHGYRHAEEGCLRSSASWLLEQQSELLISLDILKIVQISFSGSESMSEGGDREAAYTLAVTRSTFD